MIEIIAPFLTLILSEIIAIKSAKSSIWSPIGMVGTTVSAALMINPMFEQGNFLGWGMVIFSLVFYFITTKAIHEYFKLNEDE